MAELRIDWRNTFGIYPPSFNLKSPEETLLRLRLDPLHRACGNIDPFIEWKDIPQIYPVIWNRFRSQFIPPHTDEIGRLLSQNGYQTILQQIAHNEFSKVFYVQQFREIREGIWVEGPTDRLYLLKWLELSGCKLKEDLDFTIMFYGGRLLSHLSFGPELSDELIPLLRLNRNAIVILDSERSAKGTQPKKWRRELIARIRKELSSNTNSFVWVTQGRDIENYISKEALERFAATKWPNAYKIHYGCYNQLDDIVRHGPKRRRKFNYSNAKVENCRAIFPFIQIEDINVLDLKNKIHKVAEIIQAWQPKRA
jgi:hypothetical protein